MAAPSRQDREQKPDKKDAKALLRKEDRSTPQRDIGFMQEGGRGRSSGLPADRHRLLLKRLEKPGRVAEKADFFKSLQQSYGNHYVQRLVSRSASDRGASPGGRNAIPSGGGQPLDKPVRNDMEGRFGQSFSNVRVHTDVAAGNAARSLGARAFTTGQDIYFGRGAYQPASPQGRGLLAHELTHTIQQRGGRLGAQQALEVVPPDDPLEQQAEQASNAVMRDMRPAAPSTIARPPILRSGASVIQRQVAAAPPPVSANARAPVQTSVTTASWVQSAPPALGLSGGQPLNPPLRRRLEKSFRADLGGVRVHGDTQAAKNADRLGAKAFAFGPNIVLGSGASADDVGLMAHEAAHTLQQRSGGPLQRFTSGRRGDAYEIEAQRASEAAVRGESFTVRQQTSPRMQGLFGIDISLPNPLNWLADKANIIPGFRMFTIILGVNPINMSPVARSAANILRALIEFLPGGGLITQALDNSGVFEKAGAFVEKQIASLGLAGSAIKAAVTAFISSLSLSDLANLGGVWERAKKIFTDPIDRIKSFGIGLVTGIVQIVKDAILKPIAKLAEGTNGYALLKAVMGRDPITGDPVPQTAEAILEPFMKLIGQEEIWENMKKSNAIGRAFTWFKGALSGLMGFVNQIPGLFVAAFRSLEIMDIVLVPRAFAKLVGVFGGFLGKFISWAGSTIWNLLEIIFDAVSPGALGYIKKTGAALKSILKNPLPFVGNLVKAAKLGFTNFADNFGGHLKAGLIDWLTGSLSGVYIPKALSLPELGKFAISVLGITWAQIRGKIVKALGPSGETIMKGLETGFDIVVALVTGGPAAAWELIKEKLTDLKDQVVSGIVSFVTETVVKKAVPKLIAMFIPGAGFISAILSIYDTIMVFVEKISKIIQVVTAFIDSIVTIAAGNISAAAKRVESILGGLLSLAISFLAGFLGLGKVTDKIKEVIEKVRASVDKALDAAVNWIVDKAKKLVSRGLGGDPNATPQQRLQNGVREGVQVVNRLSGGRIGIAVIRPVLSVIRLRHNMQRLDAEPRDGRWAVVGVVNPATSTLTDKQVDGAAAGAAATPSAPQYDPARNAAGWGTGMVVVKRGALGGGSRPSVTNPQFDDLNLRRHGNATSTSTASYYILGHLLNQQLGGPGNTWGNLTPLSRVGNAQHEERVESRVKTAVQAGKAVRYEVRVTYGRPASPLLAQAPAGATDPVLSNKRKVLLQEQHVAIGLNCTAVELDPASGQPAAGGLNLTTDVPNPVESASLVDYNVPGQATLRLQVLAVNDSIRQKDQPMHAQALQALPGIGPSRFQALASRTYPSWEAVWTNVPGVTEDTVTSWRAGLPGGVRVILNGTTSWA